MVSLSVTTSKFAKGSLTFSAANAVTELVTTTQQQMNKPHKRLIFLIFLPPNVVHVNMQTANQKDSLEQRHSICT